MPRFEPERRDVVRRSQDSFTPKDEPAGQLFVVKWNDGTGSLLLLNPRTGVEFEDFTSDWVQVPRREWPDSVKQARKRV